MLDLKGPYDVVNAARAAYESKAAEIAALLGQGTEEATQQALALQETLDKLQADHQEKKSLYEKLVQANSPDNVAKLFVPANSPTPAEAKPEGVGTMTLVDYNKLSPKDRLAFAKAGGKLTEGESA